MIKQEYTEEEVNETRKYLQYLKTTNKKEFNKLNKRGRKFSDTILKRLN